MFDEIQNANLSYLFDTDEIIFSMSVLNKGQYHVNIMKNNAIPVLQSSPVHPSAQIQFGSSTLVSRLVTLVQVAPL